MNLRAGGDGRARFTACHELAHYVLHGHITLARASSTADKLYTDSEWQANTFAGTHLMSPRHAPTFGGREEMATACGASRAAADHMWRKHGEEGLIMQGARAASTSKAIRWKDIRTGAGTPIRLQGRSQTSRP